MESKVVKIDHRKNHQQIADHVRLAAKNTERQSMSISLVRLAPPTLFPLTRSKVNNAESRHQAHRCSRVRGDIEMRLRRPPKTKDQV
jgi:hypothetical protein